MPVANVRTFPVIVVASLLWVWVLSKSWHKLRCTRAGCDMDPAKDARTEALDLLIEQRQKLFEVYDARQSSAETKTAGVVTGAVALATINVTATSTVKHVDEGLASAVLLCLALSVLVALLARSVAGLRYRRKPLLSTESAEFAAALRDLRKLGSDESDPSRVRKLALAVWDARERDSRHMARAKELAAGVAAFFLGVGLILDVFFAYGLITGNG